LAALGGTAPWAATAAAQEWPDPQKYYQPHSKG